MVGVPDAITYANLGDGWLRGLGVAGVKFCPSCRLSSSSLQPCRTTVRVCDFPVMVLRGGVGWLLVHVMYHHVVCRETHYRLSCSRQPCRSSHDDDPAPVERRRTRWKAPTGTSTSCVRASCARRDGPPTRRPSCLDTSPALRAI